MDEVVCPVCKTLVRVSENRVIRHPGLLLDCRGSGQEVTAKIVALTTRMRAKWAQEEARRRAYESQE